MRAMLCSEYGPPDQLHLGEVPPVVPGPGQLRLRVHAAGVNFPDTLIIRGAYQLKPPMPFVPGFEVVGEVLEVGSDVYGFTPGVRVAALAAKGFGGFAEEALVNAAEAVVLPDEVDDVTAAALYTAYGTSYHALVQRACLVPGEVLLVLGASGGVGLAAVQIGKALGAVVIAAAGSPEKLAVAARHGADHLIDYSRENLKERLLAITGGRGVDVCLDPVGGEHFDTVARCMNWEGRLLVLGFAGGRIPHLPINLVLLKGYQLVGVYWGAFVTRDPSRHQANFRDLFGMLADGRIKPLVHRIYPLEDAPSALEALSQRSVSGKLVLQVS